MAEAEEERHLKLTGEFDCDPSPLSTLRHSTSHVMAQAVKRLFPDVKLAIGPAIEDGFYYDFAKAEPFSADDLGRIEEVMGEIARADHPFERREMDRPQAIRFFRERGEPFKVEILEAIDAPRVSLYQQGEFIDLCRGPHVPSTGHVRFFKLLASSGAYWRGDERNPCCSASTGPPGSPGRSWTSTCGAWKRPRSATTASSGGSLTSSRSTTSRRGRPSGSPTAW
ncbi:MAG: hypothetical protein AUH81_20145 [Candidatus Rokubacteria bacterium 13_1_40CM_4_69_5]|nr:MAG: hypothetical protein AUH81_20145 [Candidatus Rokubacteria bacterium 13_1_40CM_4_69_5]